MQDVHKGSRHFATGGHRVGGGLRHQVLRPVAPPGDSVGVRLRPLPRSRCWPSWPRPRPPASWPSRRSTACSPRWGWTGMTSPPSPTTPWAGEKLLPRPGPDRHPADRPRPLRGLCPVRGRPHRLGLPGDGAEGGLRGENPAQVPRGDPPRGRHLCTPRGAGGDHPGGRRRPASPGPHDGLPGRRGRPTAASGTGTTSTPATWPPGTPTASSTTWAGPTASSKPKATG